MSRDLWVEVIQVFEQSKYSRRQRGYKDKLNSMLGIKVKFSILKFRKGGI